ncbi:tRNA a64-2'-o-ribosylphosphate transferase [Talaromyces stipitatus ATCC 10500]|uniref:tRNA a64-2'-o-ribosylphosphate transferase n=1 Tax=Talaromyces stipitatus (strain ATCC 10500 / CBS 375.48 / QM 6759 / NRRL 1006) TaxID=441959 RepID=B8M9U4_TALSN|nr:tRNA a64-2'-o-ribosylphosphate transferase [Talaromyces stipitatus ATCC 10500]EED18096.1 tRNA a64-2'-o-ribosylphosphate transferase [Talaromyces stipitatus ATCC 10500]
MSSDGRTAYPVSLSEIEFPSAAVSVSQLLTSLRRSALSVTNRLRSIEADARFVSEAADHYGGLPLIANERCGSWYINPDQKAGSVYFKSTDGHTGVWEFSFRRLNLQVLEIARQNGGCIIVDSTRRGKLMPDALSKTVPIWSAVLNRALFPSEPAYHPVQFPPSFLGASEEAQIEKRIDGFVRTFKELKLDLDKLRKDLGYPIRLAWANQTYFYPTTLQKGEGYNLFVLCSASRRVHGAEASEGGYIQGAGDDSEKWSHGLTAPVFWANKDLLFKTDESQLPHVIHDLISRTDDNSGSGAGQNKKQGILIRPSSNLYISQSRPNSDIQGEEYDLVIACNDKPGLSSSKRLNLGCGSHKLGSRDLRTALEKVKVFAEKHLTSNPSQSLLVTCKTGKDLSVGTLLAIICLLYDDEGMQVLPA